MSKIILLIHFFLISSFVIAQEYTLKKNIGSLSLNMYPRALATDKNGNLYLSTGDGYMAKFDKNGTIQLLFNITPAPDGRLQTPTEISVDRQGNIWVLESTNSVVYKFNSLGKELFNISYLNMPNKKSFSATDITTDSEGNLWLADPFNHNVIKFSPNGRFLTQFGSYGTSNGQFESIHSITTDIYDNIWIVDNNRVQKFDSKGFFLNRFGSYGFADGQFINLRSIKSDSYGNIWIVDYNRIQIFDQNGKFLSKFNDNTEGGLDELSSFSIDSQNNVWILNTFRSLLSRYNTDGILTFQIKRNGSEVGQFNFPQGIVIDENGVIRIVDKNNNRVQEFNKTGNFIKSFGSKELFWPGGICLDKEGNSWVADVNNRSIKEFDKSGNLVYSFMYKDPSNNAYTTPQDITIDKDENIWVTDQFTSQVQKFTKKGTLLLTITDKSVTRPHSIISDSTGNIWISDTYGNQVQKFDSKGNALLKFGTKGTANNQFQLPMGIALDVNGNLWVSDPENSRIQKFDTTGKFLSSINIPGVYPRNITFDKSNNLYCSTDIGVLMYSTSKDSMDYSPVIKGYVFADYNSNCNFDTLDFPLPKVLLVANPGNYYGITDSNGFYEIPISNGTYTISQVLDTENRIIQPTCPISNTSIPVTVQPNSNSLEVNFANKVTLLSHLSSSVSSDRRRRCFTSNTVVNYSNSGYAVASNVKVYVKLPKHVIFKSADKPYVIDSDSVYVFTIGSLTANQSGSIHITDSVACVANIRGLTACTKVWITPSNNYTLPPDSPWDQSDITLSGKCIENGRVRLVIHNTGKAMADSSAFRIYLDAKLAMQKHFKLTAGDSLVLRVPANGKTVRLEADQREGHPRKSQTNLTIEGCVATASDIVSQGFVDLLPQDDAEPEVSISCLPIIDSYDPNDKLVSPIGTKTDHYTPTNSELKYTIRFQNTGTDTAYTVTILDTLSDKLDIASLQLGAASHKYSFNVSGKGKPVLKWTFSNINLPDSTRDQPGSNGFVQFSIKPKAGLAEKARIENFADIIFDYNDPVRTNTTTNVLYDVPPLIDNAVRLNEKGVVFLKPTITSFTPAQAGFGEQMTITGTNYQIVVADNIVKINGVRAAVVSASETELVVTVPAGVTAGKVSVTTLGGTAVSEVDFVLGSEQPQWSRAIRVYPNPSEGRFTIDVSAAPLPIQALEVYNGLGQKIVSKKVSKPIRMEELDLSEHGAGLYIILFKTTQGNTTRKIILK